MLNNFVYSIVVAGVKRPQDLAFTLLGDSHPLATRHEVVVQKGYWAQIIVR